jgi:succinate dehydrogenase / fumarate reductase cytochrome b subunit
MLVDFWSKGVRYQKALFIAAMIVTIVAFIPIAYIVLRPALVSVVAWFFYIG